jgi:hypothetical protein
LVSFKIGLSKILILGASVDNSLFPVRFSDLSSKPFLNVTITVIIVRRKPNKVALTVISDMPKLNRFSTFGKVKKTFNIGLL